MATSEAAGPRGDTDTRTVQSRLAAHPPLAVPAAAVVIATLSGALWLAIFKLAAALL
jgi:hypothetical protein